VSMVPGIYLFRLASGLVQIAGGLQSTVELLGRDDRQRHDGNDDHPGHDLRPHRSEARDRPFRRRQIFGSAWQRSLEIVTRSSGSRPILPLDASARSLAFGILH